VERQIRQKGSQRGRSEQQSSRAEMGSFAVQRRVEGSVEQRRPGRFRQQRREAAKDEQGGLDGMRWDGMGLVCGGRAANIP